MKTRAVVFIRMSDPERTLIRELAYRARKTVNDYVRDALLRDAKQTRRRVGRHMIKAAEQCRRDDIERREA